MSAQPKFGFRRHAMATTAQVRRLVKERDGHVCVECGMRRKLTVHHIRPISNGGSAMEPRNMVTLCRRCHDRKHQSGVGTGSA